MGGRSRRSERKKKKKEKEKEGRTEDKRCYFKFTLKLKRYLCQRWEQ
jgi:hypothetical protein